MNKPDSIFVGQKGSLKKQKIYEILQQHQQLTTKQIHGELNKLLKWGLTMNELSNILIRTKQFEKIGFSETYGAFGERYRCCVWGINYE